MKTISPMTTCRILRIGIFYMILLLVSTPIQLIGQEETESVKLVPQLGITSRLVETFSVSSDGKYALSGDWDGILRLWDVETGFELKKLLGEDRQSERNEQTLVPVVGGRFETNGHRVVYWDKGDYELGVIDFENPSNNWKKFEMAETAFFIEGGDAVISHSAGAYDARGISLKVARSRDGSLIETQNILDVSGRVESTAIFPKDNLLFFAFSGVRNDNTAIIAWDYKRKKIAETYYGVGIRDVKISPSGKKILGIGEDYNAYVWNRRRPDAIKRYGRENDAELVDGDTIVNGGAFLKGENEIALDLSEVLLIHDDGRPAGTNGFLAKWDFKDDQVVSQALLPQGVNFYELIQGTLFLLTGQNSIDVWNSKEWKKDRSFIKSENARIKKIELSLNEQLAMIEFEDARVVLLDLEKGQVLTDFEKKPGDLRSSLSASGELIAIGDNIYSTQTKEMLSSYDWWYSLGFFEDSDLILAQEYNWKFDDESTISLVNALTGKAINTVSLSRVDQDELDNLPGNIEVKLEDGTVLKTATSNDPALKKEVVYEPITADVAALSPDQNILATADIRTGPDGEFDLSVRFWDFNTGEYLFKIEREGGWVDKIDFSEDGSKILISSHGAEVWRLEDKKLLHSWGKHITDASFVHGDEEVLASFDNGNIALYSLSSPDSVIRYKGSHLGRAMGAVSLSSKKLILSAGEDGIVRMFEARNGDQKLRIVPRSTTDWAVIDSDGRFDYGNESTDHFIWEYQNRVYTINQLRDEYYEPKLFSKYLGVDNEPLQDVERLIAPPAYPHIQSITKKGNNKIVITVTDQGDGIGKVPVYINGRELTEDARKLAGNENKQVRNGKLELTISLQGDARIDSTNQIHVSAYDQNNYVAGRGETMGFNDFGTVPANSEPPNLYAVVVGVSEYRGDEIDLKYAAKDAEDFAAALKIAASRLLLEEEKTKITVLSTTSVETSKTPGKTNILNALKALEKTKKNDIVVVYFAGHGVIHNSSDDYYFLTKSAASANLFSPAVIRNDAISSKQLAKILRNVPAKKRVLIFDTCGAGKLIEDLLERSVPSSQIRAIEDLNRRTGFHVLAGSTADQLSYEAGRFSQGILTHTILSGMRGGALVDDQYVDVQALFEYCRKLVPDLALGVGGIQRPQYASPEGGESFNIGRLEPSDRDQIVVQDSRPVFIRPSIVQRNIYNDPLSFATIVADGLRNESQPDPSTGRSKIIYSGATSYPDAYQITGPYSISGNVINMELTLLDSKSQVIKSKTINARESDIENLILEAIREMVEEL